MVCQFVPELPSDIAGLLAEFADISRFLQVLYVRMHYD